LWLNGFGAVGCAFGEEDLSAGADAAGGVAALGVDALGAGALGFGFAGEGAGVA
jgi:hypothetical protein